MKTYKFHLLGLAGLAVIGAVFFFQSVFFVHAVEPAVTVTSLMTNSTTVKENTLVPVFKVKFNTVQSNEALQSINVKLTSSVANDPTADANLSAILEDNAAYYGGWQLWKDGSGGVAGTFEQFTDQQMLLSSSALNYGSGGAFSVTLDTAQSVAAGETYYVALKTDNTGLPSSATFSATLVTNGVVTSASTQPTISQLATSTMTLSTTPRLVRMEYTDNGTSGFNQGDTLKMIFNQAMDFSYLSNGLSWYIYAYSSNWNSATFGSSPTLTYTNAGGVTNDAVTITVGSSPTVTTASTIYYSLPAKSGSWSYGSKLFDITSPTVQKIHLVKDIDNDGKAKTIGDQIAFAFSEGIDALSEDGDVSTQPITPNTINTALPLSGGTTYDGGGAKPTLTWWGPSVLVVTLNANLSTDLIGKTVDPASTVKDFVGNSDSTVTAPTIALATVAPVSSVTLEDLDTANSWIGKHDLTIKYILPTYASSVTGDADFHTDFYLIPANLGLDLSSMYRINSSNVQNKSAGVTYTYNGTDTDYSLYYDSRTNFAAYASGSYSNLQYFSLETDTKYVACVVVSIDGHSSEATANMSIPRCSEPMSFTAENWSEQTSSPWVKSYSPNSSKVYTNTRIFSMTFSEALDATAAQTLSNYSLKYDSDSNWTYDTELALSSVTYDENSYTVYVKTSSNLVASRWYYLKVKTGVKDLYGTSVYEGAGMYFQTATESDTTPPTVSTANLLENQTSVSASLSRISIKFDEPMDLSTITSTSATLDPSVPGVSVTYDVAASTLKYMFANANLSENTAYTFTLNGSLITDSQGNMLDGDANGTAGGNYVLHFTTGDLDTTKPKITWTVFDGYNLKVGFDREMMESDVEDYKNWTLTCGTTTQSLNWATFSYDEYNFELSITGLYCSDGTSYTLTAASAMRGGNKSTIDTTANSSTDTVASSSTSGYGDTTDSYYGTYSSVYAWPSDNSASATTDYYVSLPTTKALQDGGRITIQWPSGYNISNVTVKSVDATQSTYSYNNNDLNGSWNGIYDKSSGGTLSKEGVIKFFDTASPSSCPSSSECIKNDTLTNTTTLTLWMDYNNDGVRDTTAVSQKKDYIYFDLSGVVNPSKASEVHWYTNTGGYKLNISTKTSKGAPLEGPISSSNFAIVPAGTGTLSGVVTANTVTGDPVAGATVYAYSNSTSKKAITNSSGQWTINNVQKGTWWFWVDPPKTGQYSTTYSSTSNSCEITASVQSCTYNGIVKKFDFTISGTIVHDTSLAGKSVTIWQNGSSDYTWSSVTKVLESDGTTSYTIYASSGKHQVGIYESLYSGSFVSPQPKTVDVKGNTSNINFNIQVANLSLPITVLDDSGNGLSNVSVGVYSYDEGYGFSNWGTTGADGKTTLKVVAGDYTAYAYQYGFGNGELAVSVKSNGTISPVGGPVFKFKKADSTIKGTVLDDKGDPIQWASVTYKDSNGMSQWSSTDTNGSYTLWVAGGTGVTGTVKVYAWQYGGNLSAKSGVTVTDFSVPSSSTITGIDFQYDPDAYGKISGQIIADGSGISWASVWAEEVNKTTRKRTGNYYGSSWTTSDSSGNYTLEVTKNSATTCYDLHGWASNYGELPKISCVDISSGNVTGKDWDLGALKLLTVNVTGAPTGVTKVYLDLKQSTTDTGLWTAIDLANGSGSASLTVSAATYTAKLSMEGYGEFKPDSPDANSFTISADKTLTFSMASQVSGWTLTGTVKDDTGTVVDNARVVVVNRSTGDQASTKTSSSGVYTLSAKALSAGSTYTLYASKAGFINSETSSVTAAGTYNLTLTKAGATISGTVYDKDGKTVEDAWIIARAKDSDKWTSTKSLGDGTFSLSVPSDSTVLWDVEGVSKNGYRVSVPGVASGTTNLQLNLKTLAVTGLSDQECVSVVPSQGGTLSDEEDSGVGVKLPANSYTDTSGSASATGALCAQEIATPLSTTSVVDVVVPAKEIIVNDSQGQSQTKFQSDLDLSFTLTKADVDAAIANGNLGSYSDLKLLHLNYWEDASGTWVNIPATLSIGVKSSASATSFTDTDYDTAVNNIVSNASYYSDYEIIVHAASNHLTIFGVTAPSDTTAPAAPSNLNATAGNATVTLDWNDSSESDFLEYAVYRSTSSSVQAVNDNQVNTSQVTSSTYTDTTVTNGVIYYYAVAAADKSGNWSSLSSSVSALPKSSSSSGSNSSSSSSTSGGGSASSSSSSDSSDDTEDSTDDDEISDDGVTADADLTADDGDDGLTESTLPFLDTVSHWAESYIEILYGRGVIDGYSSGSFGPDNNLTRAEAAKIAINTWEFVAPVVSTEPFSDVLVEAWYAPYVAKMKEMGVVEGYPDGTFQPDTPVNRAEAVKMFLGVAGKSVSDVDVSTNPFTDVDSSAWYAPYVLYAQSHGYVGGYKDSDGNLTGLFGPGNFITRSEISKIAVLMAGLE